MNNSTITSACFSIECNNKWMFVYFITINPFTRNDIDDR